MNTSADLLSMRIDCNNSVDLNKFYNSNNDLLYCPQPT